MTFSRAQVPLLECAQAILPVFFSQNRLFFAQKANLFPREKQISFPKHVFHFRPFIASLQKNLNEEGKRKGNLELGGEGLKMAPSEEGKKGTFLRSEFGSKKGLLL